MTTAKMKAKIVRVVVEQGRAGLFYATSPDLKGLLVANPTIEGLKEEIPTAIEEMYLACDMRVCVTEVENDSPMSWVAVPQGAASSLRC
ncbi:hypothetical protein M2323_001339 [Rhodoblastus acidophilus]|uniref:hypothetical protein n=1 Tax=Rhodoblastus acidophilus TaxID=1074 RepID=UPI00222504B5|nr:hypothetical protein [Rhodoblastus acidophilus]MCW2283567.1 hypothetical protein [Rhodoblastus acidophilus]MCW2332427.1 hypothetical protein [Rhodoblastus acidophilus]